MIEELDRVVLLQDIPEHHLQAGDVGTVVLIHQSGMGYTIEFLTLRGETVAVETLRVDQIRAIQSNEMTHARQLASA